MSTPVFVATNQTEAIHGGDKFRVTFSQGSVEHWLAGGTILDVYKALSVAPWGFVISEPPLDNSPVYVADIQISHSTVGSAPPGSVADLVNSLEDLTFYNAYEVTRVERLTTTAPIIEHRLTVNNQALDDQQQSGLGGLIDKTKKTLTDIFGNVKGIAIALAVVATGIAVIYIVKETRAARSA